MELEFDDSPDGWRRVTADRSKVQKPSCSTCSARFEVRRCTIVNRAASRDVGWPLLLDEWTAHGHRLWQPHHSHPDLPTAVKPDAFLDDVERNDRVTAD